MLVRGNTLLLLNLSLDIVDSVGGFDLEGDGLTGEATQRQGRVSARVRVDDGRRHESRKRFEQYAHVLTKICILLDVPTLSRERS